MTMSVQIKVCPVADLPPGSRKLIQYRRISVGVFNVDGALYAMRNVCPHRGAPVCRGQITGTMLPSDPGEYEYGLEGLILRCPWHAWEFDIRTGMPFMKPETYRVTTYPVSVADGTVLVTLPSRSIA
jgi:nitrite reductase (NADH) small subunit